MIRCRLNQVLLYIHSVLLDFIIRRSTGYPGRVYLFFVFPNPSRQIKQPCKSVTILPYFSYSPFIVICPSHSPLVASAVGQNSVTNSITRCVPQQQKLRLQLIRTRDCWSRDIAFGVVTRVRVGQPRNRGSIPNGRERAFFVLHNIRVSGACLFF
jgi:hypothetical protein